jgi:hypothetical protein
MSTSRPDNTRIRTLEATYSEHHHRGAAAFLAAAGYAVAVALSGAPVALLAGLFVPLSLGTESAVRAAHPGPFDTRSDALATGLGIVVGVVATGVVVFAARALVL